MQYDSREVVESCSGGMPTCVKIGILPPIPNKNGLLADLSTKQKHNEISGIGAHGTVTPVATFTVIPAAVLAIYFSAESRRLFCWWK